MYAHFESTGDPELRVKLLAAYAFKMAVFLVT